MNETRHHPFVTCAELESAISHSAPFVLDIRSSEAFDAGHIPGSVNSDYSTDGWRVKDQGGLGVLPEPKDLAALFGRLGLKPEDAVVIVSDGEDVSDLAAAARVYWTLKVAGHKQISVLEGGYRAWRSGASRTVETGPVRLHPATHYPVVINDAMRSDLHASRNALRDKSATFIDARSSAHYEGREKAGSVGAAGHIPGARSRNYAQNFDADTKELLPKAELAERFRSIKGPIISYCNTGHTAALNWFVLSEVLGRPDVRLFDGSMSQWASDPDNPVETGAEAE